MRRFFAHYLTERKVAQVWGHLQTSTTAVGMLSALLPDGTRSQNDERLEDLTTALSEWGKVYPVDTRLVIGTEPHTRTFLDTLAVIVVEDAHVGEQSAMLQTLLEEQAQEYGQAVWIWKSPAKDQGDVVLELRGPRGKVYKTWPRTLPTPEVLMREYGHARFSDAPVDVTPG